MVTLLVRCLFNIYGMTQVLEQLVSFLVSFRLIDFLLTKTEEKMRGWGENNCL